MGYDPQTVFHITSLTDIRAKSLLIYRELQKAIRKHLEGGNIAGLELCDKSWNGKNWLLKEPDNLSFTWRTNQQFASNDTRTGLDVDGDNAFSGDEIPDDKKELMDNFDVKI